jgi:hypothetical protein
VILSVIETCQRLKLSTRNDLSAVLPGLANTRRQCLPAFTPRAWTAQDVGPASIIAETANPYSVNLCSLRRLHSRPEWDPPKFMLRMPVVRLSSLLT